MEFTKQCVDLVKYFEGLSLSAVRCPAGVLTIGYGHTEGVKINDHISREQADLYLLYDLGKAKRQVDKYMNTYNFNQSQYDALVSFAFNIGSIDQLTAHGTRTIEQISAKILEYCKCKGKVLKGLERRRKAEEEMFNPEKTEQPAEKKKSYDEIAHEVIQGLWGNGQERKNRLKSAGYQYQRVQNKVNEILKNS